MTRMGFLRTGYAALGLTFLALAATFTPAGGALLALGLVIGFAGAVALSFSGEDLPRFAGLAIVGYFLLCFVAFVASNGATIRIGGANYFVNDEPSPLFQATYDYLVLGLPFVFAAAAGVSVWEAGAPRWFLVAAIAGFILLAILTVAITPSGATPSAAGSSAGLSTLFSLAALAGAIGAFWASARPEGARVEAPQA